MLHIKFIRISWETVLEENDAMYIVAPLGYNGLIRLALGT